nr:aspartyl protease family protein 1-like [Ipomoea batatas]
MYSPNASSTSEIVRCNGTLCGKRRQCLVESNACAYSVAYLSQNTSSQGVLVEDVLHLVTEDSQQKSIDAPITLGCGIVQTGAFLDAAAPNGLFGLGVGDVSVPSILASKGITAKSFSMCFGQDGLGRIVFGDKGSSNQGETPLNVEQSQYAPFFFTY